MFDIKGKFVVVTGGAHETGLSCVKELLRNGAKGVAIIDSTDIDIKELLKTLAKQFGEHRAVFVRADISKTAQLEGAFKSIIDRWKTIDIVINDSGVLNDRDWELEIDINCKGVVKSTLLGYQYMGKDKGGKGGVIVNIASVCGLEPNTSCPVYAATQHFIVSFGRSLGTPYHFKRTAVKIMTMCPGLLYAKLMPKIKQRGFVDLSPIMEDKLHYQPGGIYVSSNETVAQTVVNAVTGGSHGSVWVIVDKPAYQVEFPDILRKTEDT